MKCMVLAMCFALSLVLEAVGPSAEEMALYNAREHGALARECLRVVDQDGFPVADAKVWGGLQMSAEDFKTNTVFCCYPSSMNSINIPLLVRGAHLAQGIPALTPAAGMVGLDNVLDSGLSIDINSVDGNGVLHSNGWPTRTGCSGQWRHSDIKDVSYFYVHHFYDFILQGDPPNAP